jgi:predicted site-specific integrase-resolvase
MATSAKMYRPDEIAKQLGISGKVVRSYLRSTFTRPADAKGTTWVLSADQAKQTVAHFKSRNPEA